jgi:hypothetical protein
VTAQVFNESNFMNNHHHLSKKPSNYSVSRDEVNREADAARERVSGYSSEKRDQLRYHAKGAVAGAKPKVCCP